jgi:uncharacterized protein YuzE
MKFDYDPETDALYVRLSDAKIIESEEVQPGIILDFDEHGQVVAIEVLRVNQRRMTQLPVAA